MVTSSPSTQVTANRETRETPGAQLVHSTRKKFRIDVSPLKAALRTTDPDERDACLWLHAHCQHRDLSKAELSSLLRKPSGSYYAADSIIQLLSGARHRKGENTAELIRAIQNLREIEDDRGARAGNEFIETRLFQIYEERALKARARCRILPVFGMSQIGKTATGEEYKRRHNHGQTIMVEIPEGAAKGKTIATIAKAINIEPTRHNRSELEEKVLAYFDPNTQLIVDEAHRVFETHRTATAMATMSWFRELYNRAGCSIIFHFTPEDADEFTTGPHAKKLKQIWRRGTAPLNLPSIPPDDDAEKFAKHYGLPPAPDKTMKVTAIGYDEYGNDKEVSFTENPLRLQREMLKTQGLGKWIDILRDAADMAKEQRRKITWGAVLKAQAQAALDAEIIQ